jgi:hypothetical protein
VIMRSMHADKESLVRIFLDEVGVEWQVRETDGRKVPASRGERCLIFRSSQAIRRVWNYPAQWRDLGPDELIRVSWNR